MYLNADLGEGCGDDAALMPLIHCANIACGGHAGDADSMATAIRLALAHGVHIGAHPSYADRAQFGRVETGATPEQIREQCEAQLRAFRAVAAACGARVHHVKAHGALYNRLVHDNAACEGFLQAVANVFADHNDTPIAIMGMPDSTLAAHTRARGWSFIAEMFADRHYEDDGRLTPRSHPDALIHDPAEAIAQVLSVRDTRSLRSRNGQTVLLQADTVCVHGDGEGALALARQLREVLDTHTTAQNRIG